MTIVTSDFVAGPVQVDGRRWVRERHVDHMGVILTFDWLAPVGADITTAVSDRAALLPPQATAAEVEKDVGEITRLGSLATVTTNYALLGQVRAALRLAYKTAVGSDAAMLGDFLASLTDAQLQTLFAMTAGQVTTLRTNRLTPATNAAAAIRAATGT